VPSGQAPMPHGGVANARSLTARDANRAIIKCFCDARHLRTVSERSGTIFTIVRSGTVERAPASYASRRIEWVQPQFGSGARGGLMPIETSRSRERSCDWSIATVLRQRGRSHNKLVGRAKCSASSIGRCLNAHARVLSASHRSYSSKRVPAARECLNIPSVDRVVALAGQCWRGTIETMPP
jgi:hypothetical protein